MAVEFKTVPGYEKDAEREERGGAFSRLRAQGTLPLICLVVALVPAVAICVLATPKYAMNPDDHIQQLYASGRFLGASAGWLMPYSLLPVSAPLSALYRVLPGVPWYPLMLVGGIVVSYAIAAVQALRSRLSDALAKVVCVLLLMFETLTTFYLTYTVVAFLVFGAGLMLVLRHAAFERRAGVTASDIFGCLLAVWGYALRPESGLAALVVFCPFAFWVLIKNRNVASIVRGAVVLALIALTTVGSNFAYSSTPGWEGYTAYLDAGRDVMDFPVSTTERLQAADPDMSENDIDMLYDWLFIDKDVFNTESFEKLGQGVDHYALGNLVSALKAKRTYPVFAIIGVVALAAWALAADLKRRGSRAGGLAAAIAVAFAASCALLIVRARVRTHVLLPLIVMALFALVVCAHAPKSAAAGGSHARSDAAAGLLRGRARVLVPVLTCVLALGICCGFWYKEIRSLNAETSAATVKAVNAYIEDNPDELIVFGGNATLMYTSQNAFSFESWDCPENVLPAGSVWGTYTAPWQEFCAHWGITNEDTFSQLPALDDAVCIGVPEKMEHLRSYIEEHTGKSVELELVEELGPGLVDTSVNLGVYRFSFTE